MLGPVLPPSAPPKGGKHHFSMRSKNNQGAIPKQIRFDMAPFISTSVDKIPGQHLIRCCPGFLVSPIVNPCPLTVKSHIYQVLVAIFEAKNDEIVYKE